MSSSSSSHLSTEQTSQLIAQAKEFCVQNKINTDATVALTVHQNFGTEFSSLIVNFKTQKLLSIYPDQDACSTYKEGAISSYLYCYNDHLPVRSDEDELVYQLKEQSISTVNSTEQGQVFCCSSIVPYKPRRLDAESKFTSFLSRSGDIPGVVFEVVKQINNGPIVSTDYYKLENNQVIKVSGPFTQKLHAFKNYKCATHNFFFSVDLYRTTATPGANRHHMRLNPRTNVHITFLEKFFKDVLKPSKEAEE